MCVLGACVAMRAAMASSGSRHKGSREPCANKIRPRFELSIASWYGVEVGVDMRLKTVDGVLRGA